MDNAGFKFNDDQNLDQSPFFDPDKSVFTLVEYPHSPSPGKQHSLPPHPPDMPGVNAFKIQAPTLPKIHPTSAPGFEIIEEEVDGIFTPKVDHLSTSTTTTTTSTRTPVTRTPPGFGLPPPIQRQRRISKPEETGASNTWESPEDEDQRPSIRRSRALSESSRGSSNRNARSKSPTTTTSRSPVVGFGNYRRVPPPPMITRARPISRGRSRSRHVSGGSQSPKRRRRYSSGSGEGDYSPYYRRRRSFSRSPSRGRSRGRGLSRDPSRGRSRDPSRGRSRDPRSRSASRTQCRGPGSRSHSRSVSRDRKTEEGNGCPPQSKGEPDPHADKPQAPSSSTYKASEKVRATLLTFFKRLSGDLSNADKRDKLLEGLFDHLIQVGDMISSNTQLQRDEIIKEKDDKVYELSNKLEAYEATNKILRMELEKLQEELKVADAQRETLEKQVELCERTMKLQEKSNTDLRKFLENSDRETAELNMKLRNELDISNKLREKLKEYEETLEFFMKKSEEEEIKVLKSNEMINDLREKIVGLHPPGAQAALAAVPKASSGGSGNQVGIGIEKSNCSGMEGSVNVDVGDAKGKNSMPQHQRQHRSSLTPQQNPQNIISRPVSGGKSNSVLDRGNGGDIVQTQSRSQSAASIATIKMEAVEEEEEVEVDVINIDVVSGTRTITPLLSSSSKQKQQQRPIPIPVAASSTNSNKPRPQPTISIGTHNSKTWTAKAPSGATVRVPQPSPSPPMGQTTRDPKDRNRFEELFHKNNDDLNIHRGFDH